jgi:hypothetical protein
VEALSLCLVGSRLREGKVCIVKDQILKLFGSFEFIFDRLSAPRRKVCVF